MELLKTRTPPWRRGPPLPARVTVTRWPRCHENPHAAAALAWLRRVPDAVSVAAIHRPHSSCARTGGRAKTPCSTITRRPAATRWAIAATLSPKSASCARDTRLNCLPASLAIRTSCTGDYRPQRGTFAPGGGREWRGERKNARLLGAEGEGFEPPRDLTAPNGVQGRRIQ